MEIKSDYYLNVQETLEKYEIPEEAIPFAAEGLQTSEELMFGFMVFLIT